MPDKDKNKRLCEAITAIPVKKFTPKTVDEKIEHDKFLKETEEYLKRREEMRTK